MGQFSHTTSVEHDASVNDTRFSDFMSNVREFGRAEAAGKDALPMLTVAVVRAVADGVVDLDKDSDGNDAAARIYTAYAQAKTKKAVHERTDNGLKANISKLRQIITFAGNPKYDAVDVLNRAIVRRKEMEEQEIDVKPAYAAYVDVARAQNKQDDPLTDEQITECVGKAPPRDKTLEGELEKIQKAIDKIITGENPHGIKDQSSELVQAHELIGARLAALMQARQDAEDDAKLAEIEARRAARNNVAMAA